MRLIEIPENIIEPTLVYMRILFLGIPALSIYNFGSAILKAVGDTRRPLFFLLVSGVLNIVFNLFFVIVLHMSVAGVALATVISQYISAALVVVCLIQSKGVYQLSMKDLHISSGILKQILRIGVPAGIQSVSFAIASMAFQSSINSFGAVAIAGNTAASNIEGFVSTSMNAFNQTAVSFASQNMGAKKKERIVPICCKCVILVAIVSTVLSFFTVAFGEQLLSLYNTDPEVIACGMTRLRVVGTAYIIYGLMEVSCGMVRGMGYSLYSMIVTLVGVCGLRILWIYTVFPLFGTQASLFASFPVSWFVTALLQMVSFYILYRKWAKSV